MCGMGPCRLTKDGQVGVCGATIDTIQARNLVRSIAAGAAAHSDHGRDMAFILKAVANGETEGYVIRDVAKLRIVAANYGIPIEKRSPERNRQRSGRSLYRAVWAAERQHRPGDPRPGKAPEECGQSSVSYRAASIAKWSRRCTARILAMTRTPSIFCSTRPHGAVRRVGRQHDRHGCLRYSLWHTCADPGAGESGRVAR